MQARTPALVALATVLVVAAVACGGDDGGLRLADVAASTYAVGDEEDGRTVSLDAHTIDGADDDTAHVILLAGGCRIPGAVELDGGDVAVAMRPDDAVSVAFEGFGEPCPAVDTDAVALLEGTVGWSLGERGELVLEGSDGTTTALEQVTTAPAHP